MKEKRIAQSKMFIGMAIFGTIGVMRSLIDTPSGILCCLRGLLGGFSIYLYLLLTKKRFQTEAFAKGKWWVIVSGALIGINWIFLFEAFRFTTVSIATLCYYMAPVFVMILAPVLLKESLTVKKIGCIIAAVIGIIFVMGIWKPGENTANNTIGIIFGLVAALLYAGVILMNKKMPHFPSYEKTIVQMLTAGLVMLPYILLVREWKHLTLSVLTVVVVLVICIVHTGLAYVLYFGSFEHLSAPSVAIFSYLDPVVAVLASALLLHESIGWNGWLGAVIVLGSTLVSELDFSAKRI